MDGWVLRSLLLYYPFPSVKLVESSEIQEPRKDLNVCRCLKVFVSLLRRPLLHPPPPPPNLFFFLLFLLASYSSSSSSSSSSSFLLRAKLSVKFILRSFPIYFHSSSFFSSSSSSSSLSSYPSSSSPSSPSCIIRLSEECPSFLSSLP